MIETLEQLLIRLRTYSLLEVAIEIAVIALVVYVVLRFLRGTGGAGIIKGVVLVLVVGTVLIRIIGGDGERLGRINFLYDRAVGLAAIALLIIFQPELRRALVRLGETTFFRPTLSQLEPMINAVVAAAEFNSKNNFGLLIAISRNVGLGAVTETGTQLNAEVSAPLLQSIFWPNSALHDLGVVIRGNRIIAASVQFPLTKRTDIDPRYGSRHRAAIGITEESDAIAIVVSEETGGISIAERGELYRMTDAKELRQFLVERLLTEPNSRADESRTPTAIEVAPKPGSEPIQQPIDPLDAEER